MEFTNLEAEQPSEETPKPYQNFQNYASTEDTKMSTAKEKTRPTPKEPVKVFCLLLFVDVVVYVFLNLFLNNSCWLSLLLLLLLLHDCR